MIVKTDGSFAALLTTRCRSYKFSPPTQVRTCSSILGRYRPLVVSVLTQEFRGARTSSVDTLTQLLCHQVPDTSTSVLEFSNFYISKYSEKMLTHSVFTWNWDACLVKPSLMKTHIFIKVLNEIQDCAI